MPLNRRPGGLQAFKFVYPPGWPDGRAEQRTHAGHDWLYVLSGRIRLLLGTQDVVLRAGEVAEFDCRTPHAFANPGPAPAEVLGLFGPQGERMHLNPTLAAAAPPGERGWGPESVAGRPQAG